MASSSSVLFILIWITILISSTPSLTSTATGLDINQRFASSTEDGVENPNYPSSSFSSSPPASLASASPGEDNQNYSSSSFSSSPPASLASAAPGEDNPNYSTSSSSSSSTASAPSYTPNSVSFSLSQDSPPHYSSASRKLASSNPTVSLIGCKNNGGGGEEEGEIAVAAPSTQTCTWCSCCSKTTVVKVMKTMTMRRNEAPEQGQEVSSSAKAAETSDSNV
ncbi:mucin-13-like [Papaver somniferum]|uniref:mucin-13-like n=1 Tax=Papaver somniferum TaxID=3469 RepID=UPI000E6FB75B|nr:mucin-13-like [Papaver somniferum]